MFNSAAMFFERRCSSQLDIPTLWVVPDEEDGEESSSSSNRRRRRPRHSLPLSNLVKPRRPSLLLTPATPSTALMLSPVSPEAELGPEVCFETTNDMISGGRECSAEYPLLNNLQGLMTSQNEAKVTIRQVRVGLDNYFLHVSRCM